MIDRTVEGTPSGQHCCQERLGLDVLQMIGEWTRGKNELMTIDTKNRKIPEKIPHFEILFNLATLSKTALQTRPSESFDPVSTFFKTEGSPIPKFGVRNSEFGMKTNTIPLLV